MLGLEGEGGLTPDQVKAIQDGVTKVLEAYRQITDALIAGNKVRIDASTERINSIQKEIDALEEQFDKESELKKEKRKTEALLNEMLPRYSSFSHSSGYHCTTPGGVVQW